MSTTVISRCGVTVYDVSTQITEKLISKLITKNLPNVRILKINLEDAFYKNGEELYHIYIALNKPENVDELMNHRSNFSFNKEPLRITRTLPKFCPLYNKSVTGLKIKIHQSVGNVKLNESDLRKRFRNFGIIRYCKWTNEDQTEALFAFEDYDSVDKIILYNSSMEIKRIKVDLEKTWTDKDYTTYERPYAIHVTNLPLCVTSEEISTLFQVPIAVILLYPCFRREQSRLVDGRSSSEAWIKNFSDEKTAQMLAKKKTGAFLRTNKIECKAMLEPIDGQERELCERFEKGQCPFTMDTCHFKHYSCSEPDTCDDINCWFGHTDKRTTVSISRLEYRLECVHYRVKFSNLPSNVTHKDLMARLNINPKFSRHLILQPAEENQDSPRMAYLKRQPVEKKLRRQIDMWHNMPFSSILTQKIQCQLEIDQDFPDWNDSTDITRSLNNSRCLSPVLSTHSARSDTINPMPCFPSAANTSSCRPSVSKNSHIVGQSQVVRHVPTHPTIVHENKPKTNTLKSKSVPSHRQPPSDLSRQWRWTNQMILYDQFDHDEFYWIETESNKEKNVVAKIYMPKNDRTARIRAQCERVALERLTEFSSVPKLLNSNVNTSNDHQSNKELWTIMKLFNGETLSDYIKGNKLDLREALYITRQLLNIIKQIHDRNVIHRDIQPKNILIEQRSNINEINLMLINFSSAWINNYQWTHSIEDCDEQLGNEFYRMPQFENQSIDTEQNETNGQFRYSPTIDTTGICAILFWMITGHEPKESQDISGQPPHKLRDNPKIIEKKIIEMTAFRMEMKIHEHLYRHLMLIFDRSFGGPEKQWSVNKLDYQLQFIISLIDGQRDEVNYFPSPPQNTNNSISSLSIPLEDSFIYVVSLIHHLKHRFAARYSQCVRWSTEEKNRWSSQDGKIEHVDLLIFRYKTKNLSIDLNWNVKMLRDKHFSIDIEAKINDKIDIDVPMGIWKIDQQTNHFHLHFNNFEMEMKILINIICQSIAF